MALDNNEPNFAYQVCVDDRVCVVDNISPDETGAFYYVFHTATFVTRLRVISSSV